MLESASAFFAIFRGYLRLIDSEVPARRGELLQKFNEVTEFDTGVLERIVAAGNRTQRIASSEVIPMFADYLTTLEKVMRLIDHE